MKNVPSGVIDFEVRQNVSTHKSVLLIGGPDAGKSNYLFRLWLSINAKQDTLRSNGVPTDLSYLNAGAEQLLRGSFADKTSTDVHNFSVIPVTYETSGGQVSGDLVVPDCPGEQWLSIYKQRVWSSTWDDRVSENCGCLVFIRADSDQIVAPLDWVSVHTLFGAEASKIEVSVTEGTEYAPPTQVVLVDWLQCLRRAFTEKVGAAFRPRVGIVVAAWDCLPLEQQEKAPFHWLAHNFPLLGQFLRANTCHFEFKFFGVSVVGGDLKNAKFKDDYKTEDPVKTGYVIAEGGQVSRFKDLTIPVAWAMGFDGGLR